MLKVFKTDGGKGEWVTGSGEKERQGRWEQHVKARRGEGEWHISPQGQLVSIDYWDSFVI